MNKIPRWWYAGFEKNFFHGCKCFIKIWWVSGGDGRGYHIWRDSERNKSRLEVSGTFVAHGSATLGTTNVKALRVDNDSVLNGSVTIDNALQVKHTVDIRDGKLNVQGGIENRGTLHMNGNDIKDAQSLNVLGTLKGEGEVFSDKFKPLTHNEGRIGYPTKRFDLGYINNIILSNFAPGSDECITCSYNLKTYDGDDTWYYQSASNAWSTFKVLSGHEYIKVPAGYSVNGVVLTEDTYYKVTLNDNSWVVDLKQVPYLNRVHITAEYANVGDEYKKNLLLLTPEGGHLYHNDSEVLTKGLIVESLNTTAKTIPEAINEVNNSGLKTASADTGLTANIEQTNIHIAIDDEVMFIFDCGNATSHLTGYVVEPNEGGGTTAIIGHENSTCVVEENEFGGTTVIID